MNFKYCIGIGGKTQPGIFELLYDSLGVQLYDSLGASLLCKV